MTELEKALLDYDENFEKYWDKAFSELKSSGADDCKVWLVGASSYLFSVGGVKFAVDLQIRRKCDLEKVYDRLEADVALLDFLLVTHQHDDHFCVPLINRVKDTDTRWYIPSEMPKRFVEAAGLSEDRCVFLNDSDRFEIGKVAVRAFRSPHVRPNSEVFMPELGYEISVGEKRVLIVGDVRDYSYRGYPDMTGADLCILHLWAGDNAIDEEEYLPRLENFVDFSLQFKAKRYFLCHLYEIGRKEKYMWHQGHAGLAIDIFNKRLPNVLIDVPKLATAYELW